MRAVAVALLLVALPRPGAASEVAGVPLPRGSRSLGDGLWESGQPFRLARFVARDRAAAWRAIHVFQAEGRTRVYVVPGAPPPP
jgi:hypothetical protein